MLLRVQLTPTQPNTMTLNATNDYSYASTRQVQRSNTSGGAAGGGSAGGGAGGGNNTLVVPRFVEPNPRITATQQGQLLWGTAPVEVCAI